MSQNWKSNWRIIIAYRGKGRATAPGLGESLLAGLGGVGAGGELGLGLAELGQVEGGDLLRLLNLLLVGADLALQLVNQGLGKGYRKILNFAGFFCCLLSFFSASEERVPKQFKQVSFVDKRRYLTKNYLYLL